MFLLVFTMFTVPLPHMLYLVLRYAALGYLFIKYVFGTIRRNKLLFFLISGYGIVVLYSTIINKLGIGSITSAIGYVVQIADIYFMMCTSMNRLQRKIDNLFQILLGFAIITDVLIFVLPYDPSQPAVQYFVGTKFTVSYLHGALVCLYEYRRINGRARYRCISYALLALSILVTRLVQCTTGTIMCFAILLMCFIPRRIWKLLCSWQAIAILSGGMLLLIFGEMTILNDERLIRFITNLFKKNANLTGRTIIFKYLPLIVVRKPFLGYGYYNTVIADYMGTVGANPQNGFMKIIVDSGFVGFMFYTALMILSTRCCWKIRKKGFPLLMFLYAMLLASSMEINLTGSLFYLTLAMIYACSMSKGECNKLRTAGECTLEKVNMI